MLIVAASLLVGLAGVALTLAVLARLVGKTAGVDPHACWALGLVGLVPAWLVVLLALLGSLPAPRLQLVPAVSWVLSVAAALIGAIGTEGRVRAMSGLDDGQPPTRYWRLGVLAVVPAWAIAVLGYTLR